MALSPLHRRIASSSLTTLSISLSLVALASQARAQVQTTRANAAQSQEVQVLAQEMKASTTVAQQILALSDDKEQWTPVQRKLSSDFIYAARMAKGQEAAPGVPTLETGLFPDAQGRVPAVVHNGSNGTISQDLRSAIVATGGEIIADDGTTILVNVPLSQIEMLAERSDVDGISRYSPPRLKTSPGMAERVKRIRERPMVPFTREHRRQELSRQVEAVKAAILAKAQPPVTLFGGNDGYGDVATNAINFNGADTGTVGEGVKAHDVATAYARYGVTGRGLRIGVMSDGNLYMANSQATNDLPPTDATGFSTTDASVTVAVDDTQTTATAQSGPSNNSGEGTAMMEIVHDVAPDAKIFFATAYNTSAQFAKNIMILRYKYKCDIIIDDVSYFAEAAFSDDNVAQAVNQVTADGALYFSSAGNEGHLSAYSYPNSPNGTETGAFTASAWEGDFVDGGSSPSIGGTVRAGNVNAFTTGTKNPYDVRAYGLPYNIAEYPSTSSGTTTGTGSVYLYWSDKTLGGTASNPKTVTGATNDYDLYVTNAAGTSLYSSGTTTQAGGASQQPYESASVKFGYRIYILKKTTAAPCALHLTTLGAYYIDAPSMAFTTTGQEVGHSAAAQAFGVAAAPATTTYGGPYPNAFNAKSPAEYFTSDGPRTVFWNVAGGPNLTLAKQPTGYTLPIGIPVFTPATGGLLFANGGVTRQKPEITAADGAASSPAFTSASGLNPFYGTSAAAPHAGAIAALVKSYYGTNGTGTTVNGLLLSVSEMRTVLTSTAIDIEKPGVDATTGYGIVMPAPAIAFLLNFCNPNSVSTYATTANTATITWTTNLPSTGTVRYGLTSGALNQTATETSPTTTHSVTLTNLTPGTTYRFQVASTTPSGGVAYADQSERTLVTAPTTSVGTAQVGVSAISLAQQGATATVTLTNSGTGTATNVRITSATLGTVGTTQTLPATVGSIAAGASAKATLAFPAQASGTKVVLKLTGTDDSGVTFTTSTRVTIP